MAFCKSRLTHPVRVTPMGFLRSTSAITLGSISTRVFVIGLVSGMFEGCAAGGLCPYSAVFCNEFVLDPIKGLEFFADAHRYRWRNNWVLHNVSEVVSHDMSPFARDAMEKYKHGPDGWLVRGDTIHRSLDRYLRGEVDLHSDKWSPWIDTLLSDQLFQGIETLATEYRVVDRYNSVGGSLDFLVRFKDDKNFVILGDLKTVSSKKAVSSRKPATAQLGAYAKFLSQFHPKLIVTECVTVVSGPEKCKVIRQSPEDDCIPAWEKCWGKFQALQPRADF